MIGLKVEFKQLEAPYIEQKLLNMINIQPNLNILSGKKLKKECICKVKYSTYYMYLVDGFNNCLTLMGIDQIQYMDIEVYSYQKRYFSVVIVVIWHDLKHSNK